MDGYIPGYTQRPEGCVTVKERLNNEEARVGGVDPGSDVQLRWQTAIAGDYSHG
jgi:hypothetical protein